MSSFVRKRMQFLDALRGLAALAVVVFHYTLDLRDQGVLSGLSQSFATVIGDTTDLGKFGVAVFFMISGYIIPTSLKAVDNNVGRFCVTRFFRLYPLYWLVLVFAYYFPWPVLDEVFTRVTVLANLTMVQGFLGRPNIIGASWTLQIELVFYASCVGLAMVNRLERPRTNALLCLGFLALAFALAVGRAVLVRKLPVALPLALSLMFFGTLWREATLSKVTEAQEFVRIVLPVLVLSLLPISYVGYNHDFGYNEHWQPYVTCYSLAIIVFTLGTTLIKIGWQPLVFIGQISYSLYLLHPFVASIVYRLGFRADHVPLPPALYEVTVIGIAILLSWVTFNLIERPFVRLGHQLVSWKQSRRLSPAE